MKGLDKRKFLASKVLGVGMNKILFDTSRLEEIKEAITKQDIRDLYENGAITIKERIGRRKYVKRTTKRGFGKIKKMVRHPKRDYMIMTRKLRRYSKELLKQNKMDKEKYFTIRKMIRAKTFKDKSHLKEYLGGEK
jgi:large subunit ribosomal protein L19e